MTDSNLVGTSFAGTNTKDLKLQLYIESDDGTKIEGIGGENTKVKEIHLPVYKASEKQAEYEDDTGSHNTTGSCQPDSHSTKNPRCDQHSFCKLLHLTSSFLFL